MGLFEINKSLLRKQIWYSKNESQLRMVHLNNMATPDVDLSFRSTIMTS